MKKLTYKNQAVWDDPAPSMDNKEAPSPPQRTVEEYERDKELGINSLPHWHKNPIITKEK